MTLKNGCHTLSMQKPTHKIAQIARTYIDEIKVNLIFAFLFTVVAMARLVFFLRLHLFDFQISFGGSQARPHAAMAKPLKCASSVSERRHPMKAACSGETHIVGIHALEHPSKHMSAIR